MRRVLFYSAFIVYALQATVLSAQEKLILAVDLIRHGDRTPIKETIISPHYWKEGLGELTEQGRKEAFLLGQEFRKKYVEEDHLLPPNYQAGTIYVRSTDYNRTKATAHSLLVGLYPDNTRGAATIPVHFVPKKEDKLLISKPRKDPISLMKLYWLSHKYWWEKTANLQPELKRWRKDTGLPLKNFEQLDVLADIVHIRQIHQIPLPKGVTQQDVTTLMSIRSWVIPYYFKLKEISYPTGHNFLKQLDKYFKEVTAQKTPLKYILFSGHDSTLLSVMATLGSPLEVFPGYTDCLNFSLYENNNQYYVRISYNNKPVTLPGCQKETCTLPQFEALTQH